MKYKIRSSTCTRGHVNINTHENIITINLVNILDRNCPLRTQEMAFQSIKNSKFVGEQAPTNS